MNQMTERDIQGHSRILGWLFIGGHAFFLMIGVFVYVLLNTIGAASRDVEAVPILNAVATGIAVLMAILGLPGIVAGYGLLRRMNWGRVLAIVIGILNLVNFPVGTVIGIYALWVLMQPAAAEYFSTHTTVFRDEDDLTRREGEQPTEEYRKRPAV